MAREPHIIPSWKEITFKNEGLDARAIITRTDIKGIVTFVSKAYVQMSKFNKKELIGKPHSIVRHPFMPEVVFKNMWDTIKEGKKWKGIVINLRKDGYHYWTELKIKPINESGDIEYSVNKIVGYLAIRKELSRHEIQKAYELYKQIRMTELLKKKSLKDWERSLLKILHNLPKKAEDMLLIK